MKFTLVLLISAAVVGCALSCSDESWSVFKNQFNKNYHSEEEELRRRNIYCENVNTIEKHNKLYKRGESTYEMGVNQFADLTQDEFMEFISQRASLREYYTG